MARDEGVPNWPIEIYRGDDFAEPFTREDGLLGGQDISDFVFAAELRRDRDTTVVTATFTINKTDEEHGVFQVEMAAADTAELRPGRYVWDLEEVDDAGFKRTLCGGEAMVIGDVTR